MPMSNNKSISTSSATVNEFLLLKLELDRMSNGESVFQHQINEFLLMKF